MKNDPGELLRQALQMPAAARAALAGSLLQSLDQDVDVDAEAAWRTEIQERLQALDAGTVRPVPWPEARRKIAGQ